MALAGCAAVHVDVTVDRHGAFSVEETVALQRDFLSLLARSGQDPLQAAQQAALQAGYAIKPYENQNLEGFTARKLFSAEAPPRTFDDLLPWLRPFLPQGELQPRFAASSGAPFFSEQDHFFFRTYSLNTDIDLSNAETLVQGSVGQLPFALRPYAIQGAQQLLRRASQQTSLRLVLQLPLRPLSSNATEVSQDGRKMTWIFYLGQHNPLQVSVRIPRIDRMGMTAGLFIALLGTGIWYFWRSKQHSRHPK
ncbi:MAG: hypothetical protein IMW91_03815 [Firmicutes bacterium]|nr:hypothetical protein [Bacillota bacterium]